MPVPDEKPVFRGGKYGSRQYDPGNRSIQAWLTSTGAWHPQNQGPKRPPVQYESYKEPFRRAVGQVMTPQTGPRQESLRAESARDRRSDQTVSLPSVSGFVPNQIPQGDPAMPAITQQPSIVNKLRPKTISPVTAGSPMTQPLQQPRIPGIAGLIQGVRNPDVAYAMGQPVTSQHLGSNAYQQGQSQARLAERPGYSPPPMVPQPAGMATQRPAPGITGSSPAVSPQGMPAPGAGSLAQRLTTPQAGMAQGGEMPRQMAAAAPGMAPSAPIPATPPAFNTPYYQQRAARNATGQGSPVAGMAATRSDAPVAAPPGPATTMPETEVTASRPVRQLRTPLPQDNPSDYDAFRQFNETGVQPNTTYSGSGQEQVRRGADGLIDKLRPAGSREEGLSRINMRGLGQTQTLEQAANDPNFNQDGRFFQGAKLGVNQNGQAYFREGPKPTDFAGGAQNEDQARVNRMRGLRALENRGVGYIDSATGAFIGRGARTFASDGPGIDAFAGRLAAGGVTPSSLTPQQLEANKQSMMARLGARREQAQGIRAENQRQEAIARANQPNPLMQQLMAENPELAVRMMGMQQQGQIAQGQMGLQGQQMAMQNQQFQAGLAAQDRRQQGEMTLREKLAQAQQDHQLALQQGNPEFAIRKDEMAQRAQLAQDQLSLQERLAQGQNQLGEKRLQSAEKIAGAQGQAKVQQGMVGAVLADDSIPIAERLQTAQELMAQGGAGGQVAAAGGVPGAQGGLAARLAGSPQRAFAGGVLTKSELDKVKDMDPTEMRNTLRAMGKSDEDITVALNELHRGSLLMRLGGLPALRDANDPSGWNNLIGGFTGKGKQFDLRTGKETNKRQWRNWGE